MDNAISQAARILRDKRTGVVDDRAFTTLKHAEEYLWATGDSIPVKLDRKVRYAVQRPENPKAYRLLDERGNYLMDIYQFQVDAHRISAS